MSLVKKYNFTDEEILSFKISQIWIELCNKYFPEYNHTHKKGWNLKSNPKKSIVFKMCYKLQRETKGLLDEADYPLYVRAQLEILKIQSKNNPLVLIQPACLVGDKAWKRWKLWKKKYDSKIKAPSGTQIDRLSYLKAKDGILKTRKFIDSTLGKTPTLDQYKSNKINLLNWLNFGNISPYYAVISPYMKKIFCEDDYKKLNFDVRLYHDCINDDVEGLFNQLFEYEQ
jgi:hypothetical protein